MLQDLYIFLPHNIVNFIFHSYRGKSTVIICYFPSLRIEIYKHVYAIFRLQGRKSTGKFCYFLSALLQYCFTHQNTIPLFSYTTSKLIISILYTAECMITYIIYRCQYKTMPENLSVSPRHSPHTMCEKFILFVCELLLFGVPVLNVNLALGLCLGLVLGLGLVLELYSCWLKVLIDINTFLITFHFTQQASSGVQYWVIQTENSQI